jgi:hypothetical protein
VERLPGLRGHAEWLVIATPRSTPHGLGGRGGIDRMNDMAIAAISTSPEHNVSVRRLV